MATLEDYEKLAVMMEDAYINQRFLGFSRENGIGTLFIYTYSNPYDGSFVTSFKTDSVMDAMQFLWDETSRHGNVLAESGACRITLKPMVYEGIRKFALTTERRANRDAHSWDYAELSRLNQAVQRYTKTKRFKLLESLLSEFNNSNFPDTPRLNKSA